MNQDVYRLELTEREVGELDEALGWAIDIEPDDHVRDAWRVIATKLRALEPVGTEDRT